MSIFVSIASLFDLELSYTAVSAVQNADNPEDIVVGIAAFVPKNFYNDVLYKFNGYKNIIIDRYEPEENKGIGRSRIMAQRRYDGQDYFLQCDSHTHFEKGWDTRLKTLWQGALEETGNEKTLITAYPPSYIRREGSVYVKSSIARYPIFKERDDLPFYSFIPWDDMPLSEFPQKITKPFVPVTQICGCFIFSNHHFAENSGHSENAKYLEEEMVQAIGLFSSGFSMVFPNTNLPLYHYYYIDLDDRVRQAGTWTGKEMDQSMKEYVQENESDCRLWEKYAHVNIANRSFEEWYIPDDYR
jgi:hypothetical protein